MYNRYIPNDQGTYTRIPQEEDSAHHPSSPVQPPPAGGPAPTGGPERTPPPEFTAPSGSGSRQRPDPPPEGAAHTSPPPPRREGERGGHGADGITGILRHLLDRFHLDSVDTGDLLLLGLLFFLFREDADEELLVALGLLLIL
jgi:hypothetical protein